MCRCAWACLITFVPGIFANVSAAFRAAADRPIRVSRLSSASTSLRTSEPLRTTRLGTLQRLRLCPVELSPTTSDANNASSLAGQITPAHLAGDLGALVRQVRDSQSQ